jgi:hypothetical protein
MCYKSGQKLKKSKIFSKKGVRFLAHPFGLIVHYSSSVVSAALLAIAGTAFFLL